jgi:hypothetical protein
MTPQSYLLMYLNTVFFILYASMVCRTGDLDLFIAQERSVSTAELLLFFSEISKADYHKSVGGSKIRNFPLHVCIQKWVYCPVFLHLFVMVAKERTLRQ